MSTLLAIYLGSLLFGGFFVGMSTLGGMHAGHGIDHPGDALSGAGHAMDAAHALGGHADIGSALALPHGLHLDMSTEVHALPSGEFTADHVNQIVPHSDAPLSGQATAAFVPFLSLRFWTFGTCFFGLTGTLLTLLHVGAIVALVLSTGVGAGTGFVTAKIIHNLSTQEVSSGLDERDYPGSIGTVIVSIVPGQAGKIRCSLRGQLVDLVAESFEKTTLATGQRVLVIDYKEGTAHVVHAGRLGTLGGGAADESDLGSEGA